MNEIVVYSGLYAGSAGLLKLVGFCLLLWLARTLSVEDYANFGLLYALQTGLVTFGIVGILEAVIGLLKTNQSEEEQTKLFATANNAFIITLVSSVVIMTLLFLLSVSNTGVSISTLAYVLISGALLAFSALQTQIVRLEERHLSSLCFSFIMPLAGLAGGFVAFVFDRSVHAFFWGTSIGLSLIIATFWASKIGYYDLADRWFEVRPILMRVTPFIAVAILGWLSGYGNNYIIKLFFDTKQVAMFTFALSLSSILQLIATALNQVWSPRFFRLIHQLPNDEVEKKNRQFFRFQSLAIGIVGGVVIGIFPFTINVLKGNLAAYQSMSLELLLLFSAYVIMCPWWHCYNYFLAYDSGPTIMRIVLITSVIGIIVWLGLMWLFGSIGIYIGFVTQMLIRTIGITMTAKKRWPVKLSWEGVSGGLLLTFIGFIFAGV